MDALARVEEGTGDAGVGEGWNPLGEIDLGLAQRLAGGDGDQRKPITGG